jgi:threonine dehydrogenase-like Zn-dependent dehydrogenase
MNLPDKLSASATKSRTGKSVSGWFLTTVGCGVCPACEQGDFLCCTEKVNLGLDNNTWGADFRNIAWCQEKIKIHRHALWEIPQGVDYEEAAVLDPICNALYCSTIQISSRQDVVVFGTGPLGLFSAQMARIMGAVNIVMVGLEEDVAVRFPIAKELGATAVVNGSPKMWSRVARKSAVKTIWAWLSNAPAPILPSNNLSKCCAPTVKWFAWGSNLSPLDFSITTPRRGKHHWSYGLRLHLLA